MIGCAVEQDCHEMVESNEMNEESSTSSSQNDQSESIVNGISVLRNTNLSMKKPTSSLLSLEDPVGTVIKTETYGDYSITHFEEASDDNLDRLPAKKKVYKKKKMYSLEQKLEILEQADAGKSRAEMMKQFHVTRSTLGDILRRSVDIRALAAKNPSLLKLKSRRVVKNPS